LNSFCTLPIRHCW